MGVEAAVRRNDTGHPPDFVPLQGPDAERPEDAADMAVMVDEAQHAGRRMIPQGMGDPGEGLAVEIHVAGRIGEDRVIAPHHPVAPYLIREAFEGLDPPFERRQVLFQGRAP